MRRIIGGLLTAAVSSILVACGGGGAGTGGTGGTGTGGAGTGGGGSGGAPSCDTGGAPATGVPHVIVVIQENHTFDNYFGKWCQAPAGSAPTCTKGPACCEAAPLAEPGGAASIALDDVSNASYDPNHQQVCEVAEINGGKMDQFVTNNDPSAPANCADPRNFAVAGDVVLPYHDLASKYAVADRYFQSIAGQSSANDMYFAVAKEVFLDNTAKPDAVGKECSVAFDVASYQDQTIADLLMTAGKKVTWYGEGYDKMVAANGSCPSAPADCPYHLGVYPCIYDPSDVPFLYYEQFAHDPDFVRDYTKFAEDLAGNALPEVSFVKAIGYRTEHPGAGTKVSPGVTFVTDLIAAVEASCYRDKTLILLTWDEGGGFFDHVPPPADSAVDNQPYGTRVPLIAVGPYAKQGEVSHVVMEHSSIVKFLEWNYLGGVTGQLGARDAVVNNIGSLLDAEKVGATIPDQ